MKSPCAATSGLYLVTVGASLAILTELAPLSSGAFSTDISSNIFGIT
jgi:hypothetical protein